MLKFVERKIFSFVFIVVTGCNSKYCIFIKVSNNEIQKLIKVGEYEG